MNYKNTWSFRKIEELYQNGFRPWMLLAALAPMAICALLLTIIAVAIWGEVALSPVGQIAIVSLCYCSSILFWMDERAKFIEARRRRWLQ